ncbi:unnamed protein product [Arctogadus glacialis]
MSQTKSPRVVLTQCEVCPVFPLFFFWYFCGGGTEREGVRSPRRGERPFILPPHSSRHPVALARTDGVTVERFPSQASHGRHITGGHGGRCVTSGMSSAASRPGLWTRVVGRVLNISQC